MKKNKWLIRKASGSNARYKRKGKYSDNRNDKVGDIDNLPYRESFNKSRSYLNTTPIKRWLYSKVGENFDNIYSEFLTRIQPKYLETYKDMIFGYVAKAKMIDGELLFENMNGVYKHISEGKPYQQTTFYIDPYTNELKQIE